jgi:hypothetical protein
MFTNHVCFPMSWIVSNMWVAVDNIKRLWPAMFTKPCLFSYVSDASDMCVAVENSKRSWPANTVTLYNQICSYGPKLERSFEYPPPLMKSTCQLSLSMPYLSSLSQSAP